MEMNEDQRAVAELGREIGTELLAPPRERPRRRGVFPKRSGSPCWARD